MSLTTTLEKSVNTHRIFVEIDISQLEEQWTNIGSGIWVTNADNIYSFVDSSLIPDWIAVDFPYIGSVYNDSVQLAKVNTLLEMTDQNNSFYYDHSARNIYITVTNRDNPKLHVIHIGVIYPVSYNDYRISGLPQYVLGRLDSIPSVSISRDLLFWGRLKYTTGSIKVHNADGEYDLFGENNNLFGNECRIRIGEEDATYDEYETISTANIEAVNIDEDYMNINLIDKRKYLTKEIRYTCTALNAVTAIQEILEDKLGYIYTSSLYDTTQWEISRAAAPDVTIRMDLLDPDETSPAIDVIQWISLVAFGTLQVTAENKFTFILTDTDKIASDNFPHIDITNKIKISYNPQEVITSAKIGYGRNWTTDTYSYYVDDTRQTTIFKRYKTLRQQAYDTVIPDLSGAEEFTTKLLNYTEFTRGVFTAAVPLKYYNLQVGDLVIADIRRNEVDMIGLGRCEIIGKKLVIDKLEIQYTLRIIDLVDSFEYGYDFNDFDADADLYDFNDWTDNTNIDFNRW